jgi:hypothetical protein
MKQLLSLLLLISSLVSAQKNECSFILPDTTSHKIENLLLEPAPLITINPQYEGTLFIDFDGRWIHDLNWYTADFQAEHSGLSTAQILKVLDGHAEDFSIFPMRITTDESVYNSTPIGRRAMIIVTPTSFWISNNGSGYAFTGSWSAPVNQGYTIHGFVFTDRLFYNVKYIYEILSHEFGHTLGLNHQIGVNAACQVTSFYNPGAGSASSAISWAPIMGSSLYNAQTLWYNGQTSAAPCPSNTDEISRIIIQNNLPLREPESQSVNINQPGTYSITARVLPHRTDSIRLQGSQNMLLNIKARSLGNVDAKLRFQSSTHQDPDSLHAALQVIKPSGNSWLEVSGYDNINAPDYGNAGTVQITITAQPASTVAEPEISLRKTVRGLAWDVNVDGFQFLDLEISSDGIHFSSLIRSGDSHGSHLYQPGSLTFARLKIQGNDLHYSKVITLRGINDAWILEDLSRRKVRSGTGIVNYDGLPAGFYILRGSGSSEIVYK